MPNATSPTPSRSRPASWWDALVRRVRGLLRRVRRVAGGPSRPAARAADAPSGWTASLQTARWRDGTLEIGGWAFDARLDYTGTQPPIAVWVQSNRLPSARVEARVVPSPSPEPNLKSNGASTARDYSGCVFAATLDAVELVEAVRSGSMGAGPWPVMIRVEGAGESRSGRFTSVSDDGSAGFLAPAAVAGEFLELSWTDGKGLRLDMEPRAAVVDDVGFQGRELSLFVPGELDLASARLVGPAGAVELEVTRTVGGTHLLGSLDEPAAASTPAAGRWDPVPAREDRPALPVAIHRLELTFADGRTAPGRVLGGIDAADQAGDGLFADAGPDGEFRVLDVAAGAMIEQATVLTEDRVGLLVRGWATGELDGARLHLQGRRDQLSASLDVAPDGTFETFVPLLVSSWGREPLPPMMGTYVVEGSTASGDWFPVRCTAEVIAETPQGGLCPWFRHRLEVAAGKALAVRLNRPLADDELGLYAQAKLEAEYRAGAHPPRDAVYLESFYERMATCNPLALDRVLAEQHPDLPRYWGVRDRSVQLPPGAIPVVDGTREWWAARGGCRWVITNDWLRARFHHQPFQVVLQTWHGTMYKRIGLDLDRTTDEVKPKFLHERSLWDLLLSQNPHSSTVFRTAYAWDKPLLEEGYPRNDALVDGSGAAIRELLGIAPDKVVVLYAPTWRDNQTELVTFLDVDEVSERLGERYVILLRAHSRTMRYGESARVGSGVIDVTTYPSITDLFLATDVLVTDYSSVMFDYSVTGRPMVFFVPDLAEYRDVVRGVYFDLEDAAPGPVVMTQDAVIAAIESAHTDEPTYAAKYAAWRQRFNPWDDGHSGERVLAALFATPPRGA